MQAKPSSTFLSVQTNFSWQHALLWLCIIGISQKWREKGAFSPQLWQNNVKKTERERHPVFCWASVMQEADSLCLGRWTSRNLKTSLAGSAGGTHQAWSRKPSSALQGLFCPPEHLHVRIDPRQTFPERLPDAGPATGNNLTHKSSHSPNLHIGMCYSEKRQDPDVPLRCFQFRWRDKKESHKKINTTAKHPSLT